MADFNPQEFARITRNMDHEQLKEYKRTLLKPYRSKNRLVAGGLFALVGAIFAASMYKTRADDFDK